MTAAPGKSYGQFAKLAKLVEIQSFSICHWQEQQRPTYKSGPSSEQ
jgi:hypothetical protein